MLAEIIPGCWFCSQVFGWARCFRKTRQPDGLLFFVWAKFHKANLCNTRSDRNVESLENEYIYCFSTVTKCYKKLMGDFLICVIHTVKQTNKRTCNHSKPANRPSYPTSQRQQLTCRRENSRLSLLRNLFLLWELCKYAVWAKYRTFNGGVLVLLV